MQYIAKFCSIIMTSGTLAIAPIASHACTALLYVDENGLGYKGRTMEYPVKIPMSLTLMPTGTLVQSITPNNTQGMVFTTKYPILGVALDLKSSHGNLVFLDGMNDQGLSFSANQQNQTKSPNIGTNANETLSIGDLGTWLLGNFKTVQEVKVAIQNASLWLPISRFYGNVITPLHFAIWDKSGEGLVLEFIDGKKAIYDNPVGVMTNGPSFSWHLTNLNNYTTNNINQNFGQFGKLRVQADDPGIALTNLPSAQTAAGRFVKAAFYVNYVRKTKTPNEAMKILSQIMNNFDRPYDLTIDIGEGHGDGPFDKGTWSDATQWTALNDLSQNIFYLRNMNSMNWTKVDFNRIKDLKKLKAVSIYEINDTDETVTFLRD